MAKPLLIVIHGMGTHGADWAAPYVQRLDDLAAAYPRMAQQGALTEQVAIKPIHYDHVFESLLNRWESQGGKVDKFLQQTGTSMPGLTGLLKNATTPQDERGFVWSHILDPVTYRCISIVRDEVRAQVLDRVVTTVNEHLEQHPGAELSILAYSLGTIVAHDVLHLLGTGVASTRGAVWASDRFRFSRLFAIANAVRLGPARLVDPKPDRSVVRPVSAGNAPGRHRPYLDHYLSFANRWDPVASWQPFNPQSWGPGFSAVRLSHLHQVNVHGLQHYLDHPEVHIRLFRGLLGRGVVTDTEWHERVARFPDLQQTEPSDVISRLMMELERLRDASTKGSIDELAMGLLGFYRAVKRARERSEALFNRLDGWL